MPVNPSDYTKAIKTALKRGELCCVWVGGIETVGGPMSRVGYGEDLGAAVGRLQRTSPTTVSVDSALWVPDKGIAMVVSKAVQCDLAPQQRSGGWFDTPPERATIAVSLAVFRLYPGVTMMWHDDLIGQCSGKMGAVHAAQRADARR